VQIVLIDEMTYDVVKLRFICSSLSLV